MSAKYAECNTFMLNNSSVRVHPLAVTTILDFYQRSDDSQTRAIGTLVGYVSEGNAIDIVDAFQVTHSESKSGEVLFAQEYHKKVFKLRQKVHSKEQVLGWFSIGPDQEINEQTCSIQQFYKTKDSMFTASPTLPNPLYLMIDTSFDEENKKLSIQVYTSALTGNGPDPDTSEKNVKLGYYDLMQFHQIPIQQSSFQAEKLLLQSLLRACQAKTPANEVDGFSTGIQRLTGLLKDARKYVDFVLNKQVTEPDVGFGRELMKLLNLENSKTDELRDGGMRDALMVQYLSTLARSEVLLSEKIGSLIAAGAAS